MQREGLEHNEDAAAANRMAAAAAWSIQSRISQVLDSFGIVKYVAGTPEDQCEDSFQKNQRIVLGFPEASSGADVYAVEGDSQLLLTVESEKRDMRSSQSVFRGMLFQLQVNETIGPVPSKLLTPRSWKTRQKGGETRYLRFQYKNSSVN